ncbi:hypothetical protein GMORB2_2091 [Geosmithia morbida]|uniref:Erythromycin esterase n=1 Tax=Geosmithia morbida TaxID=1094350 RepID=A0A9P5D446_9HYPO|nr:uncharacterized protein GMORB2_2091 [Geosmithia morbida]KAF4121129.1 hypothetical protein GMORB2_2091 [Geosmithia morbida]
MSPPRRRSSRLASKQHVRATPDLASVAEAGDTTVTESTTPKKSPAPPARRFEPATPTASRLAPSHEEMHPSKCHISTAPEPSSALRLGFTDVKPRASSGMLVADGGQDTPSRPRAVPATEFTFRFAQGASDQPLSENAQRLMRELREQANIIKADMQAQRARDGGDDNAASRKIAQPKGKTGRFSEVHMAEFRKMDSIENHASAWRANRTPPTSAAASTLRGTPSKSNPEAAGTAASTGSAPGTPSPIKTSLKRTQSKANLDGTPQSQRSHRALKRTSSHARLDDGDSAQPDVDSVGFSVSGRPRTTPRDEPGTSFTKRVKKFRDDDTSKSRPISRDGNSAIPRPKSSGSLSKTSTPRPTPSNPTLARLTSPTKASAGHHAITTLGKSTGLHSTATPSKPTISLVKSASRSDVRAATAASSILRGENGKSEQARTALPMPADAISRTPGPPSRSTMAMDKELPPIPLTTPRRRLIKRVAFTPDTKSAAETQNSPSPQKLGDTPAEPVQYPALDAVLAESSATKKEDMGSSLYPDLSGLKHMTAFLGGDKKASRDVSAPSAPGTFTFRSDHTIDFVKASASGFGASPGQASLRQVRPSTGGPSVSMVDVDTDMDMPGSFPGAPAADQSSHPDKENAAPAPSPKVFLTGVAHGIANKKRSRAASDDTATTSASAAAAAADDGDDDGRAAKKRKNVHAAPEPPRKLFSRSTLGVSSTPIRKSPVKRGAPPSSAGRTPGRMLASSVSGAGGPSGTPTKKVGISMSRLNMLSRPKRRA